MYVPIPGSDLLLNIYRPRSRSPGCPPPRVPVYQRRRGGIEWELPRVTSVAAAARDLTRPSDDADTLSVSCERGAFLVPPLLFALCPGENKNYLLRAACCLLRAGLGNALLEVSQGRPRGSGGPRLAHPWGCLGDVMGNADASCQCAGQRTTAPCRFRHPQLMPPPRGRLAGAHGASCGGARLTFGRTGDTTIGLAPL